MMRSVRDMRMITRTLIRVLLLLALALVLSGMIGKVPVML
jgi:hypothetical protein